MSAPSYFATSASPFASPRSPLSAAVPAADLDTDFTTEDPRAPYLVAERAPAAPVAGDVVTLLRLRAKSFAPTAFVDAFIHDREDADGVTRLYCLQFHGPALREHLVFTVRQPTTELALQVAKAKYRTARRETQTIELIEQCQAIIGGCLPEEMEARIRARCVACYFSDFQRVAAGFRCEAVALAEKQQAA